MSLLGILIIVAGLIAVIFLLILLSARLFKKVGPNEAMIVYGLGGTKVIKGSGRIVWPMIQQARELSLELMSFDVAPTQDLYSSCLLYTSPSPRDRTRSRMPSSA